MSDPNACTRGGIVTAGMATGPDAARPAAVRRAVSGEADRLRAVVHAAYARYRDRIGSPPGPMLDDYARRIAANQAWVVEHAGRIVGVLVLEERPDCFLLDNVAVDPGSQGCGYGRVLITFAETEAVRRGWRQIRLYTHVLMTENQNLYRRLGYVETARVREHGFDRVYMVKQLR